MSSLSFFASSLSVALLLATGSHGATVTSPSATASTTTPGRPNQTVVAAHGIICVLSFLVVMPVGVLIARYMRTYTDVWFVSHKYIQLVIAGPLTILGFILGIMSNHPSQVHDIHTQLGFVLFFAYLTQSSLGYIIHRWKPKSFNKRRPVQNYVHVVLGLATIGLALYQVRTGYKVDWTYATGKVMGKGADAIWILFLVALPVLYLGGLAFLPRQFRQEAAKRKEVMEMSPVQSLLLHA